MKITLQFKYILPLVVFSMAILGPLHTKAQNWDEIIKAEASDVPMGKEFGASVAISGNTAIVGAYADDENGYQSGSAYIFTFNGTNWNEQTKITASDGDVQDFFGWSVSIDGDTAIVGAHRNNDAGPDSGAAYIFKFDGTNWSEQLKLTASNAAADDSFGYAVDISGDTVLVGAYSVATYVFVGSGTTWTQQAILTASDSVPYDGFGSAVAIDGNYAIVGARLKDDVGSNSGSAYVFMRSGTNWSEQTKLLASDASAGTSFGFSVDISGDTILVGGFSETAYVFVRTGTTWTEQTKLTASDGSFQDHFGFSVAISGNTVIVGAFRDDDDGSWNEILIGASYIFEYDGTNWSEKEKLRASDAHYYGRFGISIAIDGNTALVSSLSIDEDDPKPSSVYFFKQETDLDSDSDGVLDVDDNCPLEANADQADNDADGIGDICDTDDDNDGVLDEVDNCPLEANAEQADNDSDGIGDGCDPDDDDDGILDEDDNCPLEANADQADNDTDGIGDICDTDDDDDGILDVDDNCAVNPNSNQIDSDNDGIGDVCDICPLDADNDSDGDGVCGNVDKCPTEYNPDQYDSDCDGVGDECDVCDGGDDSVDNNNDGIPDCSQILSIDEYSDAWKCGKKNEKIIICHSDPGKPNNTKSICIKIKDLQKHLSNHGDFVGPCIDCNDEDNSKNEVENNTGFIIYPNPVEFDYHIQITDTAFENARIKIYSMTMTLVKDIQLTGLNKNSVMNFNTSGMLPGIYFVILTTEDTSYTKRLVVN